MAFYNIKKRPYVVSVDSALALAQLLQLSLAFAMAGLALLHPPLSRFI